MANWVRFSDTKATILSAGFGVTITVLAANTRSIIEVLGRGDALSTWLAVPLAGALVAGLLTLYWLVRAIAPDSSATSPGLNRFSWPAVANSTVAALEGHAVEVPMADDAWAQSVYLARLAGRKFRNTGRAVWSFAVFLLLATTSIAIAMVGTPGT